MSVVVERELRVRVRLEAGSRDDAEDALGRIMGRLHAALPVRPIRLLVGRTVRVVEAELLDERFLS
jgi:hypothetical protein